MKLKRFQETVTKFHGKRIAVAGDLMLDSYIWGKVSRISPEAPVPVVQVQKESYSLGGAANVMRNIVTLSGSVEAFGLIGKDTSGEKILEEFAKYEIGIYGVQISSDRPTTEKQRVVAGPQQLLRVDYEDTSYVPAESRDTITAALLQKINENKLDAIIFEDYGKGLLTEEMIAEVVAAASEKNILTALDPKPGHPMKVKGLTVLKPNRREAFAMANKVYADRIDPVTGDHALIEVSEILLEEWEPKYLLISLSSQGMALFRKGHIPAVIPTLAQDVYDVSGAGDTVIATLMLAMAAGASPVEAAEIANHAAGIVVGQVGTVTVSDSELRDSFKNGV
jgi:D-glycero-beta-D-manno-heptose-7-phosphate kinase